MMAATQARWPPCAAIIGGVSPLLVWALMSTWAARSWPMQMHMPVRGGQVQRRVAVGVAVRDTSRVEAREGQQQLQALVAATSSSGA
jgi:hypothetical protein